MGSDMSKEDQYKVAMIATASVAGALLIILLITWMCCCMYYERRRGRTTHVTKPRLRTSREVVQWEANPYAGWGQSVQTVSQPCGCGSQAAVGPAGGCRACQAAQAYGSHSAYDMMAPRSSGAILNTASSPYSPTPVKTTGGEYGRVLLNPPTGACSKPNIPSAQYAGKCNTGGGAFCGTTAVNQSGYLSSPANGSSGAQFVLESAHKY